jgi:hypothetical protein
VVIGNDEHDLERLYFSTLCLHSPQPQQCQHHFSLTAPYTFAINMSAPGSNDVEHKAYKALPRDMDQEIHKKPRIFIHRPTDQDAEATEEARQRASLLEAAKTIQLEDFAHVAEKPCVRNALLPAIGGGMAVGAGRFVLGGASYADE